MKHIIKLNNRYLSNWKEKIKPNGGIFVYDLEFTTNKDDARKVAFRHVPTVIIAIRNLVTPHDSTENDGTITYSVTTDTGRNSLVNDTIKPIPAPYKPYFTKQLAVDTDSSTTTNGNDKVEVNLDWLNNFMADNKLRPIDIATAFGYDGKRIYYGTKVLKGLVRLRYKNILAFADKYPDIHGHWYFTKRG